MKKMRKLIPAFAMLMVAAVMMSTASFAWFTMSANVTAEGMTVKAQAAGGLVMSAAIKDPAWSASNLKFVAPGVNDYAANIDFSAAGNNWYTNGAAAIFPTSTDGNNNWYEAEATNADSNVAANTAYSTLANSGIQSNASHYLATKLYFKAVVEDAPYSLFVSDVNVTTTSANLDKSIRVAMKVNEEWFFFAPNQDATKAVAGTLTLKYTTNTGSAYTTENHSIRNSANPTGNMIVGSEFGNVLLYNNLRSNTATEVEVYIYYEGEDENCKSAFAVNINELTITLNFTATPTT